MTCGPNGMQSLTRVSLSGLSAPLPFRTVLSKLPLRAHLMLAHVMWLSLAKEDPREPCPDRCPLLVAGALSGQFSPLCAYTRNFRRAPFLILSLHTAR